LERRERRAVINIFLTETPRSAYFVVLIGG
jgi:hypothetical protein